ncbi:unnamed protein product [Peniophora sp. CBMAI 1063]|nr:unnamed protein product [Peniophora sp. CBMAI 1063]
MLTIRPVRESDAPSIANICLLTGNAGASAEHLHSSSRRDLLGSVWALPYVHLPHTFGFVLVDDADDVPQGYLLGTTDSLAFAKVEEEQWWPPLRKRYPLNASDDAPESEPRTEADQRYISLIHRAPDAPHPAALALSPVHMHIDLLPAVQRQGWGRRMIDAAVTHLKKEGYGALWLGLDPANESADKFYARLGFEGIEGAPSNVRGLRFERWAA